MVAHWSKLKDGVTWGVKIKFETPFETVKAGDTVTVTKKSGETEDCKVDVVLWEGESYDGGKAALVKVLRG